MAIKTCDKILCVDDEDNILQMFRRTLGRQFNIYTAASAQQALKLIDEHHDFAVILTDFNMPGIDGVDFLKFARQVSPDSVQIMLTGNIELEVVIKAINETDIFRYLPKPCPNEVLCKVINDALLQYHLMQDKRRLTLELEQKNSQLAASNAKLAKKKYLLEYELSMAKIIFGKISVDLDVNDKPDGLNYIVAAKETVGGDFLLTNSQQNHQIHYLMMGDLTGHGLQSALTVLLVMETFESLCGGDIAIEQLAQGINEKMCHKLPKDLFCAATLLKFDSNQRQLEIWHGGMPDAYLLDQQGQIVRTIPSNNLPLGVLPDQDYSHSILHIDLNHESASSLFVYSDGVTEQLNPQQVMYGSERLRDALLEAPENCHRVNYLIEQLRDFQQQQEQTDDISVFELHFQPITKGLAHS